ncbi:hypothetical protein OSJ57_17610 [Sphingomonas sp. HH69]
MVAEKALEQIKALEAKIEKLEAAPKRAVSFFIDEGGALNEISSDGTVNNIGRVRGADAVGVASANVKNDRLYIVMSDGTEADAGHVRGESGKDGIPFGVDDLNMSLMEDGRTIRLAFAKGETEYAFQIGVPTMIYRGVYREGSAYEQGDTVTWGGSLWHADKATSGKPDSGDWTLAAKRGRDGRDKA